MRRRTFPAPLLSAPALAAALLLVACGGEEPAPPASRPQGPAAAAPPAAPAADARRPVLSPRGGPPGTEVTVSARDLIVDAPVAIGFGTLAGHEIVARARSGRDGSLTATIRVPASAEAGTKHYVFLADENDQPFAVSAPFLVTGSDGGVRVSGVISDEGVECTALRAGDDELYTLVGTFDAPAPGTRVVVEGTLAEVSTCQQGLTIAVRELRPEP